MKKILFILLAFLTMSSCNPRKNHAEEVKKSTELIVISADRQYMYFNHGTDFTWYESCIVLKEYLDEDPSGEVSSVSNVFQIYEKGEIGTDTHVLLISHTLDTMAIDVKHGFWVEDFPLNEEAITLSFKAAFNRLMATNCPKPHSRQVVLREEIGPIPCNPQYIFGNSRCQVYVDAVDGTVRETNPAFDEDDSVFE